MFLSVVICTYRRPDRLELALSSLERQRYQGADWEVLVVENDRVGTRAVLAVIERHKDTLPLRHIVEPEVGLSHARNTGLRLACGEYLAYLDDDAEAVPGWLAALSEGCRASHPAFCGGPSLPLYHSPKPSWFLDKYATGYNYGAQSRLLKNQEWLGGMNFVVSRALCLTLGGFRPDLGMTGDRIAYGEETDLMIRAWHDDPQLKVLYQPEAIVHHEVRPEKMTICWNVLASWAGGRSFTVMEPLTRKEAALRLMHKVFAIGMGAVHAAKRLRPHRKETFKRQQWILEVFCPWLWHFSRDWHALLKGVR